MGTQIPQTATVPLTEEVSTQETTQPIETVETSLTEEENVTVSKDYLQALEDQLRLQTQTINRLSTEVPITQTREETPRSTAPEINAEEDRQRLFESPLELIREELHAAIAPIREIADMFRRDNVFKDLDSAFANDPRFSEQMRDTVVVDAVHKMLNQPGTTVNAQSYAAALVSAIGMKAIGQLQGTTPTTPTNREITPVPNRQPAPIVRPSAPPAPVNTNSVPTREPTEIERRIMRENGFKSFEEYLAWCNMPARDVATSKLGKETK